MNSILNTLVNIHFDVDFIIDACIHTIIMATSFSLLITFIFHCVLYEKRASNSLFQHIMADTCHHRFLFVSCPINRQGMHL